MWLKHKGLWLPSHVTGATAADVSFASAYGEVRENEGEGERERESISMNLSASYIAVPTHPLTDGNLPESSADSRQCDGHAPDKHRWS